MVHHMRHFSGFQVSLRSKWCTGCTNYSGFRDESRQNGAPGAPLSRFRRPMKTKMVHHMHHFSGFQVSSRPEWCTGCTNYSGFRDESRQNGAPHAPFFRFSCLIAVRMAHWMHQLLWFSGCSSIKRRTTCTNLLESPRRQSPYRPPRFLQRFFYTKSR